MTLPTFLVIGTGTAGTTALYAYMKQHPEVYLPSLKEPRFFSYDPDNPTAWWSLQSNYPPTDAEAYEQLFAEVTQEKAVGEVSPTYLHAPGAERRIHSMIPRVKLIAILRNPADRAWSNFVQAHRYGAFRTAEEFLRVIEDPHMDLSDLRRSFRDSMFYYEHLTRYYSVFSKEQLKVFLYDDFVSDPVSLVQEIFRFLGVNDRFRPDMSQRHNVSGLPRSRLDRVLHRLVTMRNPVKAAAKLLLPSGVRQSATRLYVQWMNSRVIKPPMPPVFWHRVQAVYREDILKLQDLLQRDLSSWMQHRT
ncbi:MAG: sulfotransferase [Nitrospiraceae bacterium]|nr:MAG: sulfotransferase [Nitrospiraceae bacterium]